jgi:quercetin dioxygenase-like cupin family protein
MLVTRWQAPVVPSLEQVRMIFEAEGLDAHEEIFTPKTLIPDHRHPFDEVLMVVRGEMFLNVSGNQLLLRAGDRIRIPSNTKHSYETDAHECQCVVANTTHLA